MIRRPPRSTRVRSSAASDVYKRQVYGVTRERIRQIESKTMSKLRHPSRSQVLRDYLDCSRRFMRTAAALLCVGLAAVSCTPPADEPRDEPTSAPTDVQTAAYTLFDPDLDDAEP